MKAPHLIQPARLRRWLANRQLSFEGGFNGRTNKLVDSCYAHWVGGSFALLRAAESYAKLLHLSQGELAAGSARPRRSPSCPHKNSNTKLDMEEDHPPLSCLRAREILLLDYVQLVDVNGISCQSETAWGTAEEIYQTQQTTLEQFLSANDEALLEGRAHEAWRQKIARNFENSNQDNEPSPEVHPTHPDEGDFLFNQTKLQEYILRCCQDEKVGGLMDKPGHAHDAYHTCYALAGLSIAQNLQYLAHAKSTTPYVMKAFQKGYIPGKIPDEKDEKALSNGVEIKRKRSYGVVVNKAGGGLLRSSNPIFNMHQSRVRSALKTWGMRNFI
ncbi:unnamed protein product [Phytomonas sp. Hart1]|nr:unnamed protein product [Phytomonas sp. Hart1]|eukprot:CCW70131.1 unnamed protein product [Phytomonas sp. isolate Hart1]